MITADIINKSNGTSYDFNDIFRHLGLSNSNKPDTLTFLDDESYINEVNENRNITAVITKKSFEDRLTAKKIIISEDPRWEYYTLYNYLSLIIKENFPSKISSSSKIHSTAFIAQNNVIIGANTIIYPNVTILEDVIIGENCIIKPGAVIGTDGFEQKVTGKGIVSVFHDGKVIIGKNVLVGGNCCIDKGFSFKDTIIEDDVKMDNLVHIAHCVHVKKGAFLIANAMIGGSTQVGERAWIAPSASLKDRISIGKDTLVGMGAVVTKNIPDSEIWAGNPAKLLMKK